MSQSKETHRAFEQAYKGIPPWDIGSPQPEFMCIAAGGEFKGRVLDVGCGTGENALFLASQGHEVVGVDSASVAIQKARAKASRRHLNGDFRVFDALDLARLGLKFDTVLDCGFFHVLSNLERVDYVNGLSAVLRSGGTYIMLCFSDREPFWGGPRRVTQSEIRAAFSGGWRINYIRDAMMVGNLREGRARAWLCNLTRAGPAVTH